jgi:hypothetical protein
LARRHFEQLPTRRSKPGGSHSCTRLAVASTGRKAPPQEIPHLLPIGLINGSETAYSHTTIAERSRVFIPLFDTFDR